MEASHVPSPNPRQLASLAVLLGLGLFLTAGAFSQLLNVAFGVWFTEVFVFFGLGWVLLRRAGYEPLHHSGLAHGLPLPALFGFALGVANFFALVVPIQFAVQALTPDWLQERFDATRLFEGQTPLELVVLLAGVSIAAPVCEEFFFRGLVQRSLMPPVLSRLGCVFVTAVIFSAFHMDPVGFLARVQLGVLFGLLLLRSGSLWPSILAHSANNLVSSVLYLISRRMQDAQARAQPEAEASLAPVLSLAVMGGMALWGLVWAAQRHPELWGPGAHEEPRPAPASERPSLPRLVAPWVLGAAVALAALLAVDARGVRLSLFDVEHPLPPVPNSAPAALQAERAALHELRASARRGDLPLDSYAEERVRQAREHGRILQSEPLPSP